MLAGYFFPIFFREHRTGVVNAARELGTYVRGCVLHERGGDCFCLLVVNGDDDDVLSDLVSSLRVVIGD